MLERASLVAFLATVDGARARAFYGDVLGLRLVEETPFALVFAAGDTVLRIQRVQELAPHPFTALGWDVADLDATVGELVARGVAFARFPFLEQDAAGIWTAPGGSARVVWFKDPDGNLLSLTAPAPPA